MIKYFLCEDDYLGTIKYRVDTNKQIYNINKIQSFLL